jgi:hypothetical protein
MARFLSQIIDDEGISQAELSRTSKISVTTINKICNKKLYGKPIKKITMVKIVNGINKLIDGNKKYKFEDIVFDDSPHTTRKK